MTEPPRPPWEDEPGSRPDPTSAPPPAAPGGHPGSGAPGSPPPQPPHDAGSQPPPYAPPPSGPPGGGFGPPSGGYGPPGGPPGYTTPGPPRGAADEDRVWILATHFGSAAVAFISGATLGWIVPLIAMLGRGNQSPLVRQHAVHALNFQLLWSVVSVAGVILGTCGTIIIIGFWLFIVTFVAWIMATVFGIVAGVKAANGEPYRYPGTPTWVR